MKVLHISPYTKDDFYSAGVVADEVMDSHINRIAKMLHRKGVETTILYFSRFESRTRTLKHRDGYDVIVAKSIRIPWHVHFSFDIFEWLEASDYDLVDFRGIFSAMYPFVASYLSSREMPFVAGDPGGGYAEYLRRKQFIPLRPWFRRTIPLASILFSGSYAERDYLATLGIPRERILVQRMPVEDYFVPTGEKDGEFTVLYTGRLIPTKNVDTLIRAFKGVEGKLWIVGTGPEEKKLRTLSNELGVNTEFLGYMDRRELPRLYTAASVTVLPSFSESFGYTIAESLACGTPAIGSRVGMIPEMIEDGKNGYLFDAGNAEELRSRIQQARENLDQLSENSRLASDEYSWDSVITTVLKGYNIALGQNLG
jgi:glycosyltransferase involved in cell wall biosynthesis